MVLGLKLKPGLATGFVNELLLIGREKTSAAAKAKEKAEKLTRENIKNTLTTLSPDVLSKSGMGASEQISTLVGQGVPLSQAKTQVFAATSLRRGKTEEDFLKNMTNSIASMEKGDIPLPNIVNIQKIIEDPKVHPSEKQKAIKLISNFVKFPWSQKGYANHAAFLKTNANKYETKRRNQRAQYLSNTKNRDLYDNFKDPAIGEHFVYPENVYNAVVLSGASFGGGQKLDNIQKVIAHNEFLDITNSNLKKLNPSLRSKAMNSQYLQQLIKRSVEVLRTTPIDKNVNGTQYTELSNDSVIFKDRDHIKDLAGQTNTNKIEKNVPLINKTHSVVTPLSASNKQDIQVYNQTSNSFKNNPDTQQLSGHIDIDPTVKSFFIDPSKISPENMNKKSSITQKTFKDEISLKETYTAWFENPSPENTKNFTNQLEKITEGITDNRADNLVHGVMATALYTVYSLDPLNTIVTKTARRTPKNSRFSNTRLINLPKGHSHWKLQAQYKKTLMTTASLMDDIDGILTFYDSDETQLKIGNTIEDLRKPLIPIGDSKKNLMGFQAEYSLALDNWGRKLSGLYGAVLEIAGVQKNQHFKNGVSSNAQLNDANVKRLSWASSKMKEIQDVMSSGNASQEYKRRSIIQFRKLALTYRLSGMVQGNATGGRTISNQDFEVMFKALWGSEEASVARLQALRDKLSAMSAFASANDLFLETGTYQLLSDTKGYGRMHSLRKELVSRYNKRFSDIDQQYAEKDKQKLGESEGTYTRGKVKYPNSKEYTNVFNNYFRNTYGNNYNSAEFQDFINKRKKMIDFLYDNINVNYAKEVNATRKDGKSPVETRLKEDFKNLFFDTKTAATNLVTKNYMKQEDFTHMFGGERVDKGSGEKSNILGTDVTLFKNLISAVNSKIP
tara:strand:- start:9259 stop:11958 length:2700 start_codon:yes stop_codon:yes gene_type:complete